MPRGIVWPHLQVCTWVGMKLADKVWTWPRRWGGWGREVLVTLGNPLLTPEFFQASQGSWWPL